MHERPPFIAQIEERDVTTRMRNLAYVTCATGERYNRDEARARGGTAVWRADDMTGF